MEKEEQKQPNPTKEQMKIAMKKIGDYQQAQREAEEKSVPAEEIIINKKKQNNESTFKNEQVKK